MTKQLVPENELVKRWFELEGRPLLERALNPALGKLQVPGET